MNAALNVLSVVTLVVPKPPAKCRYRRLRVEFPKRIITSGLAH